MTEEQVVNVRGEDCNSGDDHRSVKANGVAHDVGGALDLVADNNDAASVEVEKNCKAAVSNGAAEEGSETATVDVVLREGESKCVDSQNGAGSVRNGVVENEIRDGSANAVAEELVTDHDEYVVVGAFQNGVAVEGEVGGDVNVNGVVECEISGDENGVVVTVVEGDADVNQSDREFECVDVHNGVVVDRADKEVTAITDQNGGINVQGRSESICDKDVDKSGESENVVSADVSDEKDIVTGENHDVEEVVEKNEVPVDVGGVSATTDVKECEPEDAQNSLEKGQVEPVSDVGAGVQNGLAEPSECTEEKEIAVEGEPGSKLERSEEESGSELVPEGENLTALNSTDVIGDGDVATDIAVESKGEPSVDVCEMKNGAVDSEAEPSNGAVQSESQPSVVSEMKNNAEESEAGPSVDVCQMKNNAVESESEPSNGAVERETEPSNGAAESKAEPSNGAAESKAEPSNGVVESESEPSNGAVEREAEPSNGAAESKAEPSNGVVEREAEPSNGAVESEAEPSNGAGESGAEPSNGAVEIEAEPSNGAAESEAEPSNGAAESEAEPSNGAVESEAEPSNGAAESEAEPSNGAVESEAEPSNSAVQSEAGPSVDVCQVKNNEEESESEPSNGAAEREAEPSNGAAEREAEPSNGAAEREAEPSNGAAEREAEPSNGAAEREAEPSNGAVECEAGRSNGAVESEAEPSNGAVESEAEPSNGAVESEAEPSNGAVESEAEPSNGAVETEAEPSNGAVESEAEPSNGAVESEAEPSNDAVENEAGSSKDAVASEAVPSNGAVKSEAVPSNGAVKSEASPSNGAVESEAEPSDGVIESESEPSVDACEMKNNAVESKSEPSVHVCKMKNNAVNSEAEPSSGAVQSESESSVVSEMKNNALEREAEHTKGAVESETEPSVDVSDKKTDAVESEAEPSVEGEGSNQGDQDSRPASDALDGQNMGSEVVKKPFYYLIRVPRYDDDENIKDQIKNALHQVEEKTKIRDDIRAESQTIKASCKDCSQEVKAAITADRDARDLLKSKRQEMDSVQATLNRLNNAISVGDIDGKIRNMEHMIQHETLPLNEEKQLIRQIKQLKQNREELSSNMRKQDQSQQSLDPKDNIEEHFKHLQLLKKEMEVLRNNVLKSDAATKAAKKKYSDECDKLNELLARFKAADVIRQEAYVKLQALKKQLHEKSKNFWEYRNAANKAQELAAGGKKEELQCFCVDQVERIMELWNKNDEFRRDYVRCNTRSTLRRLQTLDGRSLGPDEEPPVIPNAITERASKNISMVLQLTLEQEKKSTSTESANIKDEPVLKVVVQRTERSQTTKAKKPTKPAPLEKSVTRWGDESDEDKKEEPVRTKEEEELILKAEKVRKEEEEARLKEEEAKLKEKRRQEEIEKAKEALQRKKRNAEKAEQRAALKAQKEAEQKEKAREKRAKKKERRKAGSAADTAENTEQESAPISETLTRSMEEFDQSENPAEVTKKPQKPSQFARQTKTKSVPLAIRNRGKRRIQPWMWFLVAVIVAVALFYVGNSRSLRSSLEGLGF